MKYIYIDSENVSSDKWCVCLELLDKLDTVYVFYTENSKPIKIENLKNIHNCIANIVMVEVHNGKPNALDFVLVSYLARKTISAKKSRHIIVSGDAGYDTVIDMLNKEKISAARVGNLREEFRTRNGDFRKIPTKNKSGK